MITQLNIFPKEITLQVTETVNADGCISDRLDEEIIEQKDLLEILLTLSDQASEYESGKQLVVTFPNRDTKTMRVEIYNSYRE